MKKYMKNKDFIPEKFCNKMQLNTDKTENRIFTLFLLLNLFLIPITTKSMIDVNDNVMVEKSVINDSEKRNINVNEINIWIKNVIQDEVEEADISNNKGEIVVNNMNKIDELSLDNLIQISDINLNTNGKYKLGVALNE